MQIKILGCYGAEMPGYRTTCFQINDSTIIDAGAVTSVLTHDKQLKVKNILLTHSHMDHIKDIPLLADNVIGSISSPINIISTKEVINILKDHLFNDKLWPDFSKIPTVENPVINFREITPDTPFKVGDFKVTAVEVDHTVPTVGYVIEDEDGALAISGDTTITEHFWEVLNETNNLKALFIEVSFPNDMEELAKISGHLTPSMMANEIKKLKNPSLPVYLYHLKPNFLGPLEKEISALQNDNISILQMDETITL